MLLLYQFFRRGNSGTERLNNLLKHTEPRIKWEDQDSNPGNQLQSLSFEPLSQRGSLIPPGTWWRVSADICLWFSKGVTQVVFAQNILLKLLECSRLQQIQKAEVIFSDSWTSWWTIVLCEERRLQRQVILGSNTGSTPGTDPDFVRTEACAILKSPPKEKNKAYGYRIRWRALKEAHVRESLGLVLH